MEGVTKMVSFKFKPLCERTKMENFAFFALGVVGLLLVIAIGIIVVLTRNIGRKMTELDGDVNSFRGQIIVFEELLRKLPPPVQNIIQLDFRGPVVQSAVAKGLSIKVEDFKVSSARLYKKLLQRFYSSAESESLMQNVTSRAYCILDHAGVEAIITTESRRVIQNALERLLINGDEEAIKQFLFTAAESICNGPAEVVATLPAMK